MSSIYEALRRSRAADLKPAQAEGPSGGGAVRTYRLLALAVVAGAALAAAAIYSFGPGGEAGGGAATAQRPLQREIDPGGALELMNRAGRLAQKNDLEGAYALYRRILEEAPGYTEAYRRLGETCYRLGRYDEAENVLSEGLKRRSADARLLNNMGSVLLAKKKPAQALSFFVQARRSSADYVEPLYNMACAYAQMNRKDAALSSLRQAAKMQPEVRLWAVRDPDLASLRKEKEFEAIVNHEGIERP
jgi:tetratricopeptide (TPR) repeat protein